MTDLTFARPCTYTAPNGEQRSFAPGVYRDMPDEIADNWFVRAHLVQEGEPAAVPETAPLQHEERVQMKAALDAAEGRAKGAEAERDAANARADAVQADLTEAQTRIAALEADLDKATKPLEDGGADPDHANEFEGKPYGVKRGYQGKFAVVKQADGSTVAHGLSKADAAAKARELNAQG